jgi:hypothetical protein
MASLATNTKPGRSSFPVGKLLDVKSCRIFSDHQDKDLYPGYPLLFKATAGDKIRALLEGVGQPELKGVELTKSILSE